MKASELIAKLIAGDYTIKIETERVIDDIKEVYVDCFDADEGMCYVLVVNEDE